MLENPEFRYAAAFENAVSCVTDSSSYIYLRENDYWFGRAGTWIEVLDRTLNGAGEETVVDIGAGRGDFLAAAKASRPNIRAVGLTVLGHPEQLDYGIEWVYGDLLRPDTWRPQNALTDGSVDLSVSNLTYHWLANPLLGLANNYGLLKPSGDMFVDSLVVSLDPQSSEAASTKITARLEPLLGRYSIADFELNANGKYEHVFHARGLHLAGGSVLNFDEFGLSDEGLLTLR